MKGIIFTTLQKMIEETHGIKTWDKIVTKEKLKSGGSYTAADTYPDEEVTTIVSALSKYSGLAAASLVRAFGKYMLKALAFKYPGFFKDTTLKPFLYSVDRVIHKEVRKLYPDAILPEFRYEELGDDGLVMLYRSRRKLCVLAEGLIEGASEHFNEPIQIEHKECMHRGAEFCRLEIKKKAA